MEQNKDMYNHFAAEARKAGYPSIGDAIRAAAAAKQAQPVATFDGYEGESLEPVFTLIGTLNAGDKLCVCAPAQAAAPSDLEQRLRTQAVTPFGPEGFALLAEAADALDQLARQQAAPAAIPEAFIDFWQLMVEHGQFDGAHGYGVFYERHAKSLHQALLAAAPAHPAMPALLDHAHAEVTPREMEIAQAVRRACCNCYSPDDSADDWGDKMGDIDLARIIRTVQVSQGAAPTAADVRGAALEEAAQVCEKLHNPAYDPDGFDCAAAIRAVRAAQPNIQEAGK